MSPTICDVYPIAIYQLSDPRVATLLELADELLRKLQAAKSMQVMRERRLVSIVDLEQVRPTRYIDTHVLSFRPDGRRLAELTKLMDHGRLAVRFDQVLSFSLKTCSACAVPSFQSSRNVVRMAMGQEAHTHKNHGRSGRDPGG